MAELDYAFLADFAQVENGRLMVIGGSYTHATLEGRALPANWITSVAGRVRMREGDGPVEMSVLLGPDDGAYEIAFSSVLTTDQGARPYGDGKVGVLFAATLTIPILSAGTYTCHVRLDDVEVRTLRFEAEVLGS
ncbi:DUF6941 family protein [Curtobacterium sp. PhB115]|uniref:DUF6941 family protein n=1 Tax=Curtobacterium sp. PhB115 TaxID=2485173 RepID=UPI000F4BA822|nr:hypothetical protein [Curtobacterium sp. PhB115]ROP61327.1 hypothetical protein EDF19_3154 [Curtobacterium sp. PhB115]